MNYINLAKSEWTLMEVAERAEMNTNIIKTLRLLTDDRFSLERVFLDYPEVLIDSKELIL